MVFQCDPMDFISWYNPSQAYTVKHVSNPRLTATRRSNRSSGRAQMDNRHTAFNQPIIFAEGDGPYNDADADLFSDTSSATGASVRSSRYSESTTSTAITKSSGYV